MVNAAIACGHADYEDMRSLALVAWVKAVAMYEPDRGANFITYACNVVHGAVSRFWSGFNAKKRIGTVVSGHGSILSDSDGELFDTLADSKATDPSAGSPPALSEPLSVALAKLRPRLREFLERRYGIGGGEPQTLRQMGAFLGVSKARAQQIDKKAHEALYRVVGDDRQILGLLEDSE